MNVGDLKSSAKGSGARDNKGKLRWDLFPLHLMEEVVRVWECGEKRYATWNWAKGMKWSVPYACLVRHLVAYWWRGEKNDPVDGFSHLAHIVCNVMMLMHYEKYYLDGDDRPEMFSDKPYINPDPRLAEELWGTNALANPEYKEAQQKLNEIYLKDTEYLDSLAYKRQQDEDSD